MELDSLRYFLCVANHLSFSQAARQLYISQSALSYHISNLEKELGTPLFIRDKRRIHLTDAGHILLEEATEVCHHVDVAYDRIAALSRACSDTLRFGFLELLITPCFNQFISPFLNQNPELHGIMERSSNPLLLDDLLLKKAYDFAFSREFLCDLYDRSDKLSRRALLKDSISILVPSNHPCAEQASISDLSVFNGTKLLMLDKNVGGNCYDPCFKVLLQSHGYHNPIPDYYIRNMDDLLGQVAAGRGISIVPFHSSINLAYHGASLIRLTGDDVPCADIVLVWDNTAMSPAQEKFLSFIDANFPLP